MQKLHYYLFIFFCGATFFNAKATHNRAGEITYKWLYGYTYEIKVTTYTNINGSNLADRCEDTVYFGDGTRAVVLRSNGALGGTCAPAGDGVPLPGGTIKLNEYVANHTFPGPGNYKLSMEDPNRNAGVINIPNSVNQVFYIESYLVIPTFGSGNNSSPILTFPPIDLACITQCFYHNPGAYDIDGDSLSYELTACKGGSGATCPGYSFPAAGTGGVFHIDSLTGTLEWCNPQMLGEYNIAILIKEWRLDSGGDYFLVGYMERDMQITVGSCSNTPPMILFSNTDVFPLAGTTLTNTITASDSNGNLITLSANGGPFAFGPNPSIFTSTPGSSFTSGTFTWHTDNSHVRRLPYQVTIKAKDNDPNVSLVHFKTFNVKVIPNQPTNLSTVPSNNNILLKWNKPVSYPTAGSNSFFRYNVYRKTGLSNWVYASNETTPPAYTGFSYLGSNIAGITDTVFYDYNFGNPFTPGQDYSYVVLVEYTDGATSHISNIAASQIYVGIKEQSLNSSDILVYPNPANDNLTLLFNQSNDKAFTIELTDITGRTLKLLTANEYVSKQNTIKLNLENINPGIYFLKLTGSDQSTITKKIIKQ